MATKMDKSQHDANDNGEAAAAASHAPAQASGAADNAASTEGAMPDQLAHSSTAVAAPSRQLSLPADMVPTFRLCRKLVKTSVKAKHTANKLDSLIKSGRTPRGLTPNRFPLQVPSPSATLQLQWDVAHVQLSKTLTCLLKDYWFGLAEKSTKQLHDLLAGMSTTTAADQLQRLKDILRKCQDDVERDLVLRSRPKPKGNQPNNS